MNIKQAKEKYTLQSLLSILGHTCDPKKSRGRDLWYKSPFRPNEHTPSFHIDAHNDFYKDFGDADKGGDLIWFAQMYLKHRGRGYSVSDALKWFDELDGRASAYNFNTKAQHKIVKPLQKHESYKILSDKDIFSKALMDYLESKELPLYIARQYLRQIYFMNQETNKKMFGLGFKTRAGSFDIRTASGFKTMIGSKEISIVEGTNPSQKIDVFEGVSDFLTMLAIEKKNKPYNDVIVLNSANLYQKAVQHISNKGYLHIRMWLDNDTAGNKFEKALALALKDLNMGITISRMNHIYDGFKDLNMWHTQSNLNLSIKKNALLETPRVKPLNNQQYKLQA